MGNIGSAYGSHKIKHSIVFSGNDDDGYGSGDHKNNDDDEDDDDVTHDQIFNCFLGVFQ